MAHQDIFSPFYLKKNHGDFAIVTFGLLASKWITSLGLAMVRASVF